MKQSIILDHFFICKGDLAPCGSKHNRDESFEISSTSKYIKRENLSQPNQIISSENSSSSLSSLKKIPEYPASTNDLINRIKRNNIIMTGLFEEVMNSLPAKDKYLELTDPSRKLPLPYHYRLLYETYQRFYLSLIELSKISKSVKFEDLKKYIKENFRRKFSINELLQICYVNNEYILAWDRNDYENTLLIENSLNDYTEDINRNNQIFYEKLLKIVIDYHNEFIKKLPSRPQIDPNNLKTWHHSFDLHNIPEIPKLNLNDIPNKISSGSSIYLLNHKHSEDMNESSTTESENISNIEYSYLNLIQFSELIKAIFSPYLIPTMYYSQLVVKLSAYLADSPEKIKENIRKLLKVLPDHIKLINTNTGDIIRCSSLRNWSSDYVKSRLVKSNKF